MTILANPELPLWCAFCEANHTMDFVDCRRLKLEFPTMGGDLGRKPTEEEKVYALKSGYAWDNEKACYVDTVLGGRKPETFAEWREKKMAATTEGRGPTKPQIEHISAGAVVADISNPGYYKRGAMEAIDVVEAFDLGFHLGNAFKYMARRGLKPGAREVDDLRKSKWYIDREIARIERG